MSAATVLKFEDYRLHAFQRHGSKLPWFVLADGCKVLGIVNPWDAATRLDDDEKDDLGITDAIGRLQRTLIVSLSGLTRLAATSRKPVAKRFNKWLHSEVVVSIFLTGEYRGDSAPLDELVGSFQPLLDLSEPIVKKSADVLPFPSVVPIPGYDVLEEPEIHNAFKRDFWIEFEDDCEFLVFKERNAKGGVSDFKYLRNPPIPTSTDNFVYEVPWINGEYVRLHLNHTIPMAVLERTYLSQLPDCPPSGHENWPERACHCQVKQATRNTLWWFLAF